MDNMLQMMILQEDSRNLYVPVGIQSLRINAREHLEYIKTFDKDPLLPVHIWKTANLIQ